MDKDNVVHPYNGVPFSNKRHVLTNTRYNTNEPWKYAKWKKTEIKDHILYDSIYVKCLEYTNLQRKRD
jgi:hypothetical protein